MSISTWITEFITYKKPKIITVFIVILSDLYVKYALLRHVCLKNFWKNCACTFIWTVPQLSTQEYVWSKLPKLKSHCILLEFLVHYYYSVYEPITDTYRINADIAIFVDNRFCRYWKCLSVSVIGIGRYRMSYRPLLIYKVCRRKLKWVLCTIDL